MNIMQLILALLLLVIPCQGGEVFGTEYDEAYYVTFDTDVSKKETISLFDAHGHASAAVSLAVRVEHQWILDSLDKLFKDTSAFSHQKWENAGTNDDAFVFYNKGRFVLAIYNAFSDLRVEPALDKEYQLNVKQMREFTRLISGMRKGIFRQGGRAGLYNGEGKEIANILPHKTNREVGTAQPATRSESKPEGGDKPQPEAEGRSR